MKRVGYLWEEMTSFENLLLAYYKARRGKRYRPAVASFSLELEKELLNLQEELINKTYQPSEYRLFTIYEREKPRLIAAAPFRDRVVHHAVMNIIEPIFDKRFIFDSYACRIGKGVHRAVDRYQGWAQRYRYVLKMDIQKYFPSIDHLLLKEKLHHVLKDQAVLNLLEVIIDAAPRSPIPPMFFPNDDLLTSVERKKSIPIGNLTSQFLANLYLNDFDHFVKHQLRIQPYLRYVDDFVILANDKVYLREVREQISVFLQKERLVPHPNKAQITPTACGLNLLGYRVFPHLRRLRKANVFRFIRKLKTFKREYAQGKMTWQDFNPCVQSWLGHAKHAQTQALREKIFSDILFHREFTSGNPLDSGRFLEQQSEEHALG